MPSPVETLAPAGAAVVLPPPPPTTYDGVNLWSFTEVAYAPVSGVDEVVVVSLGGTSPNYYTVLAATGYSLTGQALFNVTLQPPAFSDIRPLSIDAADIVGLTSGFVAAAWHVPAVDHGGATTIHYAVLAPSGQGIVNDVIPYGTLNGRQLSTQFVPVLNALPTGFQLEWNSQSPSLSGNIVYAHEAEVLNGTGVPQSRTVERGTANFVPRAYAVYSASAGLYLEVIDNQARFFSGGTPFAPVQIPGEPAHAITSLAAAALPGKVAVAWADSGTAYAALYDASSNSFGPVIGLDWGGADNLQMVSLTSGGFAVSWTKGGQYRGEVFAPDGSAGGVISLAGGFAGVTSTHDVYTVGLNGAGQYVVQVYDVVPPTGAGPNVSTSAPTYTAPDGVVSITLTGSHQTVTGNGAANVFWSNNTGNLLYGLAGDDVFHLGRGGDRAYGGPGADTFAYAQTPWAGGDLYDFGAGDRIDLTGLLAHAGYGGSDPVGAGFLRITAAGADAQLWANYNTPGNDGWWLIATVHGVAATSLSVSGGVVTLSGGGGGQSVTTSAPTYVAGPGVTSITLTGSHQTIDASATDGVTIFSNNTGNQLTGGAGDDLFHLGRGGDRATGGAGADVFAYAETPWAGGTITDFQPSQGDQIDVSGLLDRSGYTGSNPFADAYLRILAPAGGDPLLQSNLHMAGNDGWWTVAALPGVDPASLPNWNWLIV